MKNKKQFVLPLNNTALQLLEQTSNLKTAKSEEDLLFPGLISTQKYNGKLKTIARIVGINKNLVESHRGDAFGTGQAVAVPHEL